MTPAAKKGGDMDEPVCFVPTGEFRQALRHEFWRHRLEPDSIGVGATAVEHHILARLPRGWLDAAVERVIMAVPSGPTRAEIRAALFPPSEPEPEEWEREAAREWSEEIKTLVTNTQEEYAARLARHFAKARRAREEKP